MAEKGRVVVTICGSCGSWTVPPDPNRGADGVWSVRWPHGPLQTFPDEESAVLFVEQRGDPRFVVLPPAEPPDPVG